MALDMNDVMALKSLEGGMSPYEQFKVGHMQAKRPSGVGIGGLVTGVAGIIAAVGVGLWSAAKAAQAREAARTAQDVAAAQNAGTAALLNRLASQYDSLFAAERAERIAGDQTITQTITDTVSGSQQGQLTAMQQAELSSLQSVQQNLFNQAVMGNLSENPQKVMLYSAPQPCGCPGCGCNG